MHEGFDNRGDTPALHAAEGDLHQGLEAGACSKIDGLLSSLAFEARLLGMYFGATEDEVKALCARARLARDAAVALEPALPKLRVFLQAVIRLASSAPDVDGPMPRLRGAYRDGVVTKAYAAFLISAFDLPLNAESSLAQRAAFLLSWILPAAIFADQAIHAKVCGWRMEGLTALVVEPAIGEESSDSVTEGPLLDCGASWVRALLMRARGVSQCAETPASVSKTATTLLNLESTGLFAETSEFEMVGPPPPPTRQWGDRSSNRITDDRFLLQEHWWTPTKVEGRALQLLLRPERESTASGYYEHFIVTLAVALGKNFDGVLALPVLAFPYRAHIPSECDFEHLCVAEDQFWVGRRFVQTWSLVWVRPSRQGHGEAISIHLPDPVRDVVRLLLTPLPNASGRIRDLLPWSTTDWSVRVSHWVEAKTGITPGRAILMIRHGVAKSIFQQTSSRGLLHFLFAELDEDIGAAAVDVSATHHYLDSRGQRLRIVYAQAIAEVFGLTAGLKQEVERARQNAEPISATVKRARDAFVALNSAYESALATGNPRVIHNAFALYVLGLLLVSTGHRKSRRPFPFTWDLILEEFLAFICDKLVVGSEARFVPLIDLAVRQIKAYRRHVGAYIRILRARDQKLADRVEAALSGKGMDDPSEGGHATQFFVIDRRGNLRPLTTRHIDYMFRRLGAGSVEALRRALADFLWNRELSEPHIRAILGHNGMLHLYGSSSVWASLEVAERLRPHIEEYMTSSGWNCIESPLAQGPSQPMPQYVPTFNAGSSGYEGRARDAASALARAQLVVRKCIPPQWLEDGGEIAVTGADIARVRALAKESLLHDEAASRAVGAAQKDALSRLKNAVGKIDLRSLNLTRVEASPVEITAARHFSIAAKVRCAFMERIGETPSGADQVSFRIAVLALGLVCLDAVLDADRVRAVLEHLWDPTSRIVDGRLEVRAPIFDSATAFDLVVKLEESTSLMAVGLHRPGWWPLEENVVERSLDEHLGPLLNRLAGRHVEGAWTLEKVCTLFQAWWFPRMRGFVFAGAVGRRASPAPDAPSLAAMNSASPQAGALKTPAAIEAPSQQEVDRGFDFAAQALEEFLSSVAVRFETFDGSSRNQRVALLKALDDPWPDALLWSAQKWPVVEHLAGFMRYLVSVGGPKKSNLRFNSIVTYWSRVWRRLLKAAWELDLASCESEVLDKVYGQVMVDRQALSNDGRFTLQLFQQYMVSEHGAQASTVLRLGQRTRRSMRGALLSQAAVDGAIQASVRSPNLPSAFERDVRDMLCMGSAYGTRRLEALGSQFEDFEPGAALPMRIRSNRARLVKTEAGRRVMPFSACSEVHRTHIEKRVGRASASAKPTQFLFVDEAKRDALVSQDKMAGRAIVCLRESAGYPSPVFHTLRPTLLTRLVLAVCSAAASQSPAARFRLNLLGSDPSWTKDLAQLRNTPLEWPFWIDRLEAWMGHRKDGSFASYFRADHVLVSETTAAANMGIEWRQDQLAWMVDRDRSAIAHRARSMKKSRNGVPPTWREVARNLCAARSKAESVEPVAQPRAMPVEQGASGGTPQELDAVFVHRLLCWRLQGGHSVQVLRKAAAEAFRVDPALAGRFVAEYISLLRETGFADFEFEQSELVIDAARMNVGTLVLMREREMALAKAWELLTEPAGYDAYHGVLAAWARSVNSQDPYWVLRSPEEAVSAARFLVGIGTTATSIEAVVVGSAAPTSLGSLKVTRSPRRLSAGPRVIPVTEFAIKTTGAAVPPLNRPRELDRLLFVIALTLRLLPRER